MDSKGAKWIKTKEKGLRYYEHPTRPYGDGRGKNKRMDRCYSIVFRIKVQIPLKAAGDSGGRQHPAAY